MDLLTRQWIYQALSKTLVLVGKTMDLLSNTIDLYSKT